MAEKQMNRTDGLEVVLQDFDVKPNDFDLTLENGIVWFYGPEGPEDKPIGDPKDYLEIRDDYIKLKEFLGKILDKGRVYYGTSHWNQDGETNCAEYANWLYLHCKNENFKRNFERATIELLKTELKKSFKPFDYQKGMKIALERSSNIEKVFLDENISNFRWRYELSDEDDESEGWFRKWLEDELGKTLRKDERGNEITDYEKTSPGFKEAFKRRFIHRKAYDIALQEFTPQFNRLVGLLGIVSVLGKPDNGFAGLYDEWKEDGFRAYHLFYDYKPLKYTFTKVNLNLSLREALEKIGYFEKYEQQLKLEVKLDGEE